MDAYSFCSCYLVIHGFTRGLDNDELCSVNQLETKEARFVTTWGLATKKEEEERFGKMANYASFR